MLLTAVFGMVTISSLAILAMSNRPHARDITRDALLTWAILATPAILIITTRS